MIPYALIKKGTESSPEFFVGHKFESFKMVPDFGVLAGNVLQLVVFFDFESANYYADELFDIHYQDVEIFNLVTMETVK